MEDRDYAERGGARGVAWGATGARPGFCSGAGGMVLITTIKVLLGASAGLSSGKCATWQTWQAFSESDAES